MKDRFYLRRFVRSLSVTVLVVLIAGCSGLNSEQRRLVDHQAPVTRYMLMDKSYHSISEHLGKVIVISFWDAYCMHCRMTLPKVGQIADAFHNDPRVVFIGINVNDQENEDFVREAYETYSLQSFLQAFSGNGVLDEAFLSFSGESVPLLVLVDQKGIVKWIGGDVDTLKEKLVAAIGVG